MQDFLPLILLALAGFFVGGVYTMWNTARFFAIVLAVLAVVAAAAGVLWLL